MRCESLHFSLPSSAKQQREIVPQTTQNLGHTYSDIFPDTATVRTHPPNFAANPEISIPLTDVVKSCPVAYRTINQYGGTTCGPCFSRVNPDTIGCVWAGEFDLNSLRVDGEYRWSASSTLESFQRTRNSSEYSGVLSEYLRTME